MRVSTLNIHLIPPAYWFPIRLDFYVNRAITPGKEANRLPFHGRILGDSIIYNVININTNKIIYIQNGSKNPKEEDFRFRFHMFVESRRVTPSINYIIISTWYSVASFSNGTQFPSTAWPLTVIFVTPFSVPSVFVTWIWYMAPRYTLVIVSSLIRSGRQGSMTSPL